MNEKIEFLKKANFQKILIFIILNIIALKFILIADDYIFANLNFNNMWKFIFNNKGTNTWDIKNGRYLGNTIGVLLSMTYKFSYLKYIRGIFMGSGIFLLILLCSKLSNLNKNISFIVSSLLLLYAPTSIYAQVYSWTSAYANYLIPTIIFLSILLILDNTLNKNYEIQIKDILLICVLGVSCQLFMENITIYVLVFSLIIFSFSYFKKRNYIKITMPLFLSSLLGAIIMFSCKVYTQINRTDTYRSVNINSLSEIVHTILLNGLSMSKFIVVDNIVLISIILVLCFFIIKKNNYKNKFGGVYILSLILYMFFIKYIFDIKGIDISQFPKIVRTIKFLLDYIIAISVLGIVGYSLVVGVKDKDLKIKLGFYYTSIIVVSMPLIIINPISTRCFFICYVFMSIICMKLMGYVLKYKDINIKKINIISTILVIVILINKYYIFNNINQQFDEIITYTEEQMINKDVDTILLPKFKYQKYIHSDIAIFMGFLYYHNVPNDIKCKTIDRDKWEQIANNK